MSVQEIYEASKAERRVSFDVEAEMRAQVGKWGYQSHPDGTGPHVFPVASRGTYTAAEAAILATSDTDKAAEEGTLEWRLILLEEVFEALAEDDLDKLYTELKQTAAVCMSWMRDIKMRST